MIFAGIYLAAFFNCTVEHILAIFGQSVALQQVVG
jgi:hypothetical protein